MRQEKLRDFLVYINQKKALHQVQMKNQLLVIGNYHLERVKNCLIIYWQKLILLGKFYGPKIFIRNSIQKGLKLFYFYAQCANEVIYTLYFAIQNNKNNYEKEV